MNRKQYLISLEKSRSVVALVAGVLIFIGTLLCVFWAIDLHSSKMLRYFTLLSNLLSATGAAFMIPYAVEGIRKKRFTLPRWVVLFQFSGAVCVSITMVAALRLIQNRRARQARARISRLWDAGLDDVELKIEAFGLGRFMGQHCENELAVPLDIFADMS